MPAINTIAGRANRPSPFSVISPEHYLRVILHRKWIVLTTFAIVLAATAVVTWQMQDIYTSETVILVDPQKIPESYIRPTVTGDVRNRLGTLEQQILSSTRLQKIIDDLKLYPEERKTMAREEVIARMRNDIYVVLQGNYGPGQDLQAFRIRYSGKEPRLVARVANQLAQLFIDENLKAREQQATDTTDFLSTQLEESRKALDSQEARLRDYRMKHIGEMPEQQNATIQILGQLQAQLQSENDALNRAEQQRAYLQSMNAQSAPVVELDDEARKPAAPGEAKAPVRSGVPALTVKQRLMAQLADQFNRGHTASHPDVKRLRAQIAQEEAKERQAASAQAVPAEAKPPAPKEPAHAVPVETAAAVPGDGPASTPASKPAVPPATTNPVLVSQLRVIDTEIVKHTQEVERLTGLVAKYRTKLEAIPVREQEATQLIRDYDISKLHYSQLLDKQLSAQTATQLELRQKGEKFSVLDPAVPAERPSKPNRKLINAAGGGAGLALGLFLSLVTEFFGTTITAAEQVTASADTAVLELIPLILTYTDRRRRKKRLILATVSGVLATAIAAGIILLRRGVQLF